jgi:hypothetical protein
MRVSEWNLEDIEPRAPLRPRGEDAAFSDGVHQNQLEGSMDRLEQGLAPGFWRAAPDFSAPAQTATFAATDHVAALSGARAVVLSAGFVLLMLVGAAVSALVFAESFGRFVAP